ncbi:MAG: hypothetical protein AAGC60_22205 [Acidobacteriota bacterium]
MSESRNASRLAATVRQFALLSTATAATSLLSSHVGTAICLCARPFASVLFSEEQIDSLVEKISSSFGDATANVAASSLLQRHEELARAREKAPPEAVFHVVDALEEALATLTVDQPVRAAWSRRLDYARSRIDDFFRESSTRIDEIFKAGNEVRVVELFSQPREIQDLFWNDIRRELITASPEEQRLAVTRRLEEAKGPLFDRIVLSLWRSLAENQELVNAITLDMSLFVQGTILPSLDRLEEGQSELRAASDALESQVAAGFARQSREIGELESTMTSLGDGLLDTQSMLLALSSRQSESLRSLVLELTTRWREHADAVQRVGARAEAHHAETTRRLDEIDQKLDRPQSLEARFNELEIKTRRQVEAALAREGIFKRRGVDRAVYENRQEQEAAVFRFAEPDPSNEPSEPCFVLTGQQGKGKTTLFCYLAKKLSETSTQRLTLLADLRETFGSTTQGVEDFLVQACGLAPATDVSFDGLLELGKLLRSENRILVVFFDGLNELASESGDAFARFNESFAAALAKTKAEDLPIRFCVSCRTIVWNELRKRNLDWFELIDKPGRTGSSADVGDFPIERIDEISTKYFEEYGIRSRLANYAVRRAFCDPIMLRYLCLAYDGKGDIGEITTVRRKEIFDRFVQSARKAIWSHVKKYRHLEYSNEDRARFEYVTMYLLHIAYRMFTEGGMSITLGQVHEVATATGHPDAELSLAELDSSRSVFFALRDQGIILTKTDQAGIYGFVFEAYFEYTLGRYFAWVLWPRWLQGGEGLTDEFKEGIRAQIGDQKRRQSARKNHEAGIDAGRAANLLSAIELAILVSEERPGPQEPQFFADEPNLFPALLSWMASAEHLGMLGKQLACSAIRKTRILNQKLLGRDHESQSLAQFDHLLQALDALIGSADFVVIWDVERTILRLAEADRDAVDRKLYAWARDGGLRTIFSIRCVGLLAKLDVEESAFQVQEIADTFRSLEADFWRTRELVAAILNIVDELRARATGSTRIQRTIATLQETVTELATSSECKYTRGAALGALPRLGAHDEEILDRALEIFQREPWKWAKWNFLFGLREAPLLASEALLRWTRNNLIALTASEDPVLVEGAAETCEVLFKHTKDVSWRQLKGTLVVQASRSTDGDGGTTAVVFEQSFLEPGYNNHIECRERLQAILGRLGEYRRHFTHLQSRAAADPDLRLVHDEILNSGESIDRHRDGSDWLDYIDDVRRNSELVSTGTLSDDEHYWLRSGPTELRYESFHVALQSAGAVLVAVDRVMTSATEVAWSLGRPPGHLANNTICMFNNIAIGARYALKTYGATTRHQIRRVLVIDCDAHHGIHTNRVFLEDPNVTYISTHVQGDYSTEEGELRDIGRGAGRGYSFNLPFPKFMPDAGYELIVERLIEPILDELAPDLIMVSAGFDAHLGDSLNPTGTLTEHSFIALARALRDYCRRTGTKVVGALEGGYGLEEMASSQLHLLNILGDWGVSPDKIGFSFTPEEVRDARRAAVDRFIAAHPETFAASNSEDYELEWAMNLNRAINRRIEISRQIYQDDSSYPLGFGLRR